MLPTGGGKSLCYQVPGLLLGGICLVVSPLTALMEDQVNDLKSRGIRALSLSGQLSRDSLVRLLDNVEFGKYDFLYLSPERLQQELVLNRIKNLPINSIAIDEAHCISQWGFDFRPAYLNCAILRDLHPGVPVMALTATATEAVLEDIATLLALDRPDIYRDSVHRPNIVYTIRRTEDKHYRLKRLLVQHPGSAIVYVSTRRAAVGLAENLAGIGLAAAPFHGGLPATLKTSRLQEWQKGKVRVMVATNAFGMGIDKEDVRLVVHFNIPETVEHYFQEAGRAGRDGKPATAVLLLGPSDLQNARDQYLGNLPTVPVILKTYGKLNSYFAIPYGELIEAPFPLRLAEFCETYSLPLSLTFNALEILDRQGVISLSQQFWQRTSVHFVCEKNSLWEYLRTYPRLQPAAQTLLRTYGGLFDFETPVNLRSISKKANVPEPVILAQLNQMHRDGMIRLETSQGDLQVRFLKPREDEKTIYAISKQVEGRLKVKRQKVLQMAAYVDNDATCRQQQLLAYFGESRSAPCGGCDVCQKEPRLEAEAKRMLRGQILETLREGPKTSRQILEAGDLPEIPVLKCLQSLLHEGILVLGAENQYEIA